VKKLIIAIDGYSSCGKSTFAKHIAARYHYLYIDSGAMYRTVTLYALQQGIITEQGIDEEKLKSSLEYIDISFTFDPATLQSIHFLNGENVEEKIRSIEVSQHVSPVSKLKFVREKMVALQREAGKEGGIVMDGRDIGTVVFPEADLKIFMTASPEIRARRRYLELKEKGIEASLEEIKKNLMERDLIDSTREESPLRQASDAIVLDNSHMTLEQQMEWIDPLIRKLMQS